MAAREGWVAGLAIALGLVLAMPGAGGPENSGPARTVRRTDLPDSIRISYEWTDAAGRRLAIDLPISRAEIQGAEGQPRNHTKDANQHAYVAQQQRIG
jgi:hypothetical protein